MIIDKSIAFGGSVVAGAAVPNAVGALATGQPLLAAGLAAAGVVGFGSSVVASVTSESAGPFLGGNLLGVLGAFLGSELYGIGVEPASVGGVAAIATAVAQQVASWRLASTFPPGAR